MSVPVVAISGFPGAGKTTLTRQLAAHFGVPIVSYDDHETITRQPPEMVRDWVARGSDYDEIKLDSLLAALDAAAASAPPFILLDTLLGRAHAASGGRIDLSLWLDVPADIALARKLRQAGQRVGDDLRQAREFAAWVASYTRQYEQFIAGTYVTQAERVRPAADVRLAQWGDSGRLLQEAVAAIGAAGIGGAARPPILTAMHHFGSGFGYERSVKLAPGAVNDDRYITSVHRDDLGMDPRGVIEGVIGAEGLPEDKWAHMLQLLPDVDVLHFGHEGGDDPVRKIYLEFVSKLRAAAKRGDRETQLVYLALKWRPGEEQRAAFTSYLLVPDNQVPTRMIDALRKGYEGREEAPSLRVGIETIRLAVARAGANGIMFVEVEEAGSSRFSYDLTIYHAGLRGSDLGGILAPLLDAYGIDRPARENFLRKIENELVGHVSLGIGRDGRDFVTVYFGVEARNPVNA